MKQNYFLAILFAMLVFVVSCQDDDAERGDADVVIRKVDGTAGNEGALRVFDTVAYPVSKRLIIMDSSEVYCINNWGKPPTRYRTLKIRDRDGIVIQEWLCENLRTDVIRDNYTWKDDPDGSKYGYFYQWEGEVYDLEQEDWDYMLLATSNVRGEHKKGFHLPRYGDLDKLTQLVGGNGRVRDYLKLVYGGCYDKNLSRGKPCPCDEACIWLDYTHNYDYWPKFNGVDPNKREGCGVIKTWSLDPNTSSRDYPNIPRLCCNIRLVRDLKPEEW